MSYAFVDEKDIVLQSSGRTFVEGSFDLGTPMIAFRSTASVFDMLQRVASKTDTEFDAAMCATLFHEYIHLIQSLRFYACQLPAIVKHWHLWDLYRTAQDRKNAGLRLMPLETSNDAKEWECRWLVCKNRGICIGTDKEGNPYHLTLLDVVEGVARILEEGYLGYTVSDHQLPYTTIRWFNENFFKGRTLSLYELLDVCEIALQKKYPGEAFVSLCRIVDHYAIPRDDKFYFQLRDLALTNGLRDEVSRSEMIVANTRGIFTSNIFASYVKKIESLYLHMANESQMPSPIFSSLLKEVQGESRRGLPSVMITWLMRYGSVPFVNSLGVIEQFDQQQPQEIDVNAVAINAFLSNIESNGHGACMLMPSCRAAGLPVDDSCQRKPWEKVICGGLCPYLAAKRAFGLDGIAL